MSGLFISFEGIDGAGKSLQAKLLYDALVKDRIDVVLCREPGSSRISEKIREIILSKENKEMTAVTEALLYAAARSQLVSEFIKPMLDSNVLVICDRYIDSSLAFQGYGRQLGFRLVSEVNSFAVMGIMPDITFLLDLAPEAARNRRSGTVLDRLESEPLEFHKRVRAGYLKSAEQSNGRIITLDAEQPIDILYETIKKATKKLLAANPNGFRYTT